MFDSGTSGTGTLMVPGMLGMLITPAKVLSSGSISGGGGVLLDVSVGVGALNAADGLGSGLFCFPLDLCEGVLDFCEALEYFLWYLVVGGPV